MTRTAPRHAPVPPTRHPFEQHLADVAAVDAVTPHRDWTPADGPMPALYISHGAPPTFEDPAWMADLFAWARRLPRPKAVLIVSAHWESAPLAITATAPGTPLVYDFGGFDPMYFRMQYATPDASLLAAQVAAVLPPGERLHESRARGLDHGAWVPLKIMYPAGDVPVLQLSIPTHDSTRLLALGARLRALREEGVLVIGSGFLTHGLPFVDFSDAQAVPGWSRDFDLWVQDALSRGDVDELAAFRTRAPGMPYAHPTVEHFTPLLLTLGAATDPATARTEVDGWMYGLSRRSLQVA